MSRRHRGACHGVDAVGDGMVSMVVLPQAVESNALDSRDQYRPAKESVCCGSHVKLALTMCDGKVEKDTVTLSAAVEQKAPTSVS